MDVSDLPTLQVLPLCTWFLSDLSYSKCLFYSPAVIQDAMKFSFNTGEGKQQEEMYRLPLAAPS